MTLAAPTTAHGGVANDSPRLLVTRRDPATQSYDPLGFLVLEGQTFTFAYLREAVAVEGFRTLPGLSDPTRRYTSKRLFRLLVRARLRVPAGYRPFSGPGWETVA
jgi:hypothetical protein